MVFPENTSFSVAADVGTIIRSAHEAVVHVIIAGEAITVGPKADGFRPSNSPSLAAGNEDGVIGGIHHGHAVDLIILRLVDHDWLVIIVVTGIGNVTRVPGPDSGDRAITGKPDARSDGGIGLFVHTQVVEGTEHDGVTRNIIGFPRVELVIEADIMHSRHEIESVIGVSLDCGGHLAVGNIEGPCIRQGWLDQHRTCKQRDGMGGMPDGIDQLVVVIHLSVDVDGDLCGIADREIHLPVHHRWGAGFVGWMNSRFEEVLVFDLEAVLGADFHFHRMIRADLNVAVGMAPASREIRIVLSVRHVRCSGLNLWQ